MKHILKALEYIREQKRPFEMEYIIYFLFFDEKLVYIGKSTTGISRIHQHRTKRVIPFNSYYATPTNAKDIDSLEKQYIKAFNPEYNKTHALRKKVEIITDENGNEEVREFLARPQHTGKRAFRLIMKREGRAWAKI